jgi:hypothetical protein
VATRQPRGRRARFCLRSIIRGWPWYYETTPVFPNEVLLRTVPNSIGFYTQTLGNWAINPNAFEPTRDDADGISLFREDFVSQEDLASASTHYSRVRVARVVAKECISLNLSLKPDPDVGVQPGHTLIPEMPFLGKRTAQNRTQKQYITDLAQKLAQIASKNKIYIPPGLPDPVARPKT